MKIKIDQLPLELCQTLLSAIGKVPQNVQLFWARNEELLIDALNKVKDFEPLTLSPKPPYLLSETKAITRGILWRKRLVDKFYADEFVEKIPKNLSDQPACHVGSYHINVNLKAPELFQELGIESANDLAHCAFAYSQITSLVGRHRGGKEKNSTLFYQGSNYFPLLLPTGEVEFMSFVSRQPFRTHVGWRGWFMGDVPYFQKGKILLKESL